MTFVMDHPILILPITFVALWLTAWVSARYVRRQKLDDEVHEDFDFILSATLTLLGLIIGFNLLVGVTRYDQRKNFEEEEANAIGTEYLRADLLPAADAAKVRALLRDYLGQRVLFYTTRDEDRIGEVNSRTAKLQAEMWTVVAGPAQAHPTPLMALVVSGMNDVLNRQGYTQAAWWNRIPMGAWALMTMIAIICNVMLGYGVRDAKAARVMLLILPFVVAVSFFLIADIDSPRGGVIRIHPQNLESLAASLPGTP